MAKKELKNFSYFKTGGTCDAIHRPSSAEELAEIMRSISAKKLHYFLLGGGTNSLVMDDHFPGSVIMFNRFDNLSKRGRTIFAGAGVENSKFAQFALDHGLTGASWMNGLPGQLGGTVRMNARCYGGEISQIVVKVEAVTRKGDVKNYSGRGIFKGYKDTVFMDNGDLITNLEVELDSGERSAIEKKMLACRSDREAKGQYKYPSCGCVFKNNYDVGIPSGKLLDGAGVKDFKIGGAEISPYHANFVYNKGATSRDIVELSLKMREAVYDRYGVWLEYEMELLGKVSADLSPRLSAMKAQNFNLDRLKVLREEFEKQGKLKSAPEE